MPETLTTTVTELPESRVRVEAEVPAPEVQKSVDRTARQLARDMRVPGFRRGRVPPQVVTRRLGREYVLDEAVRNSIGDWYAQALDAARIIPVGEPQLDLGDLPPAGEPLSFSIEIGVRPTARLGEYRGLEVGRREPQIDDDRVDHELDHLREHLARLETAEREARDGDFIVADYVGSIDDVPFEGGEGRDQLIELGAGRLIPGFEEQIVGHRAGDEITVEVTFPADYGAEELAGRDAQFALTLREVRERVLPELNDDLAVDAAGFDTLAELRDDIRTRLEDQSREAIAAEFREAVLDTAVQNAEVEVPDALILARAEELWDQTIRSLQQRGISEEAYLQIAGREKDEILEEARPDAEQALRREAVLAAVIEAEDIHPDDEDLVTSLEHTAEHEGVTAERLLERVRRAGNEASLIDDVSTRLALDVMAEAARPISVEQARRDGKLFTPGTDVHVHGDEHDHDEHEHDDEPAAADEAEAPAASDETASSDD